MTWEEACQVLGVAVTASDAEIKDQYLYKVNLLHPDKTVGHAEKIRQKAEEELKQINQAYEVLKNPANNPFRNPPKLEISPKNIRFVDVAPGQTKTTTIEIKSVGGLYTNLWIDDHPASWLTLTDLKSLTNEQLPLEVTIECTGMGEPGTQDACVLKVRLENETTKSQDEVAVQVEVRLKAEMGSLLLGVSQIQLDVARPGSPENRSFEVLNSGRGTLRGSISTTKPWITVSPTSISLAPTEKSLISLKVETASLTPGFSESDLVRIATDGGNADITVHLSVAARVPVPYGKIASEYATTAFWLAVLPGIPPFLILSWGLWSWLNPLGMFWYALAVYEVFALCASSYQTYKKLGFAGRPASSIGHSSQTTHYPAPTAPTATIGTSSPVTSTVTAGQPVIGNSFTRKYHRPSCEWARKISGRNRVYMTETEARSRGYQRCRTCRP